MPGNELNIGVKFGADGVGQVAKSITDLQNQMKRFQQGLNTAVGVDSIGRLNRAIDETKSKINSLQNFKGFKGLEGSADSAIKSLSQIENEIRDLQAQINSSNSPAALKRLNDQIKDLQRQANNLKVVGFETTLSKVDKAAADAATGLGSKLKPASDKATYALLNFGRIAQDAPFGLIGIANNIEPAIAALTSLRQSTGSAGGTIKALVSSLAGPGGVIFGVGLASTALTLLGQGFFSGGKKAKEAKEELEDFNKSLKDVASGIGRDAAEVTKLFSALSSGTLNVQQRKKALEDLKGINQEFFGSLKEEKGLIIGLEQAYDGYLKKLEQVGRAKAVESQLEKLFSRQLELQLSIDPRFLSATDKQIQARIGRLQSELNSLGGKLSETELQGLSTASVQEFGATVDERIKKQNDQLKRRAELQRQIFDLQKGSQSFAASSGLTAVQNELDDIGLRIKGLIEVQKQIGEFDIKTGDEKGVNDTLSKRLKILEQLRDAQSERLGNLFDARDIREAASVLAQLEQQIGDLKLQIAVKDATTDKLPNDLIQRLSASIKEDTQKRINDVFKREALLLNARTEIKKVTVEQVKEEEIQSAVAKALGVDKELKLKPATAIVQFQAKIEAAEKLRQQLIDGITQAISRGLQESVGAIGDAFGSILSGESIGSVLAKAGQAFLNIIGSVIQDIGKEIVAASALVETLKKTLSSIGFGAASLGIGLGLIALGGLLKNFKFSVPGFADGVTNFTGGVALVGERGPELVNLPRGSDVIPNHLLGGNTEVLLQPSIRFQGTEFDIMLENVSERRRRFG